MDLKTFLSSMALQDRETFAVRCGVTLGHLLNCTSGSPETRKTPGPKVAVAIERESDGAVTRQELREDWRECWPELEAAWCGKSGAVNTPDSSTARCRLADTRTTS